jgi:cell surface protein SprA
LRVLKFLFSFSIATIILSMAMVMYAKSGPAGLYSNIPFSGMNLLDSPEIPEFEPEKKKKTIAKAENTIKDRNGDFVSDKSSDPYYLNDPSLIKQTVEYDPKTNTYLVTEKIGDRYYRAPTYMTYEEYMDYTLKRSNQKYWKDRSNAVNLLEKKGLKLTTGSGGKGEGGFGISGGILPEFKKPEGESIFGPGGVEIRPQGNVEVLLGGNFNYVGNPAIAPQYQTQGGMDFDMNINVSVTGKIGDKLQTTLKYNNGLSVGLDAQQIKLGYTAKEDDWLRAISAGDVSFPLPTQLITGSQQLFGLKTEMQFGRMNIKTVVSQQKSEKKSIVLDNGAQQQKFEVTADQYDANRHYFLGQFFRDNYDKSTNNLPIINSLATVTNIEVWVTNRSNVTTNVRDIVGFADLGEHKPYSSEVRSVGAKAQPQNDANDLYMRIKGNDQYRSINTVIEGLRTDLNLKPFQDFEKTFARKLNSTEYTLFAQQGFISLNSALGPNEILAVAYQYTYNGEIFQVGDMARDIPAPDTSSASPARLLFLKMLKSTSARPQLPIWDLMMKNVYSLGAYQVQNLNFKLDIFYNDPGQGQKRYIPRGNIQKDQLIRVMNLDNLNNNSDPQPDGVFDFISGVTIIPSNGRIYFPVLEPFGEHLERKMIKAGDKDLASTYVYKQLYDSTQVIAQQFPEYNRFVMKGTYQSSTGSRVNLGAFGLPPGSVKVSLNGQPLTEGTDYTVEYGIGQVNVMDHVLKSGGQVKVDFENNSLFGFNQKNFMGTRWEYRLNENFKAGATVMNLSERPYTLKVNYGDDPIDNMMLGADVTYTTKLPFLTKMLDWLPFYSTKEMSNMSLYAEVARINPSHYRSIDNGDNGVVYLDDFEGASSGYSIGAPAFQWKIASTPRGAINAQGKTLFPEGNLVNNLEYGYNRAKLAWYTPTNFLFNNIPHLADKENFEKADHYVRQVVTQELYPAKAQNTFINYQTFLDLAFYPNQRGPYNYEFSQSPTANVSKGINLDGSLKEPKTRWAGIQRALDNTNFEQSNFEYVQFWLLDPFLKNPNNSGDLYLNLGSISEDVLRDSRLSYENGLFDKNGTQHAQMNTTPWAWVPRTSPVTQSFDNDPNLRKFQDVGLDGAKNEYEREIRADFLTKVKTNVNLAAFQILEMDPSSDDFKFYQDQSYLDSKATVLQMYKHYNGLDNNTPVAGATSVPQTSYSNPDNEDLNRDNTLSENEEYYQYRIPLSPNMTPATHPYVVSVLDDQSMPVDHNGIRAKWYQFKIPVSKYDSKIGGIQDFRNIQFMRLFVTNFKDSVVLRFTDLQFLRNQWRTFEKSLQVGTDFLATDNSGNSTFTVNGVNLEENGSKSPVNYVMPPGIPREIGVGTARNVIRLNEQALNMNFCNIKDGDARACYKNLEFDFRKYEKFKLFIHAEPKSSDAFPLGDKDISAFVRIGNDFNENYYEYEVPLKVTKEYKRDSTKIIDQLDSFETRKVWPLENDINLVLSELVALKRDRNSKAIALNIPYAIKTSDGRVITILGNPDIGLVKTIMLGIKNRAQGDPLNPKADDDGQTKCGEVWVNEMRLTGLSETGGTAALANVTVKLADLGTVAFSGDLHTIGFGQIEQKVDQRFRDDFKQYSINTNLNLGKLFPKVMGIQLPFFAQYSKSISTPEFDPFTYDINYNVASDDIQLRYGADSASNYLHQGRTLSTRSGFSFTGVRIAPDIKQKHPHVWDPQNFTFNYSFNSILKSSPFISADWIRNYSGDVSYAYSASPKYIEPFKKIFKKDKPWLKLIKEINLNLLPSSVSFTNKLDRRYGLLQQRSLPGEIAFEPFYNKFFTWDRTYSLNYNPFKSVSLTFAASNKARIDEGPGGFDKQEQTDSIWKNIYTFGRNTNYNHSLSGNYNIPINKIPLFDFVSSTLGYNSTFNWNAGPLKFNEDLQKIVSNPQGNLLNTTQGEKANINLNMDQFYNKFPGLKKYNSPPSVSGPKDRESKNNNIKIALDKLDQDMKREKESIAKLKDKLRLIRENKSIHDTIKAIDIKSLKDQIKSKKIQVKEIRKNKKTKQFIAPKIVNMIVQPLLSIKKVSINYDISKSTILPGYMPNTKYFGIDPTVGEPLHWQIAAGKQPGMPMFAPIDKYSRTNWLDAAAGNGWITDDTAFNQQFQQQYTKTISGSATVEPFKDVKIDLTMKYAYTNRYSEIFKKREANGPFEHLTPIESGSFSYSDINLLTFFQRLDTFGINQVYKDFENNRIRINQRLREQNPNASGEIYFDPLDSQRKLKDPYTVGYGPYQQDVLIPAFLAAYRHQDVNKASLNPFGNIPLPNWNITYNGLTKIPIFKKIFKSFSMKHGYSSETQLTQYNTELRYKGGGTTSNPSNVDSVTNNYYPYFFIPSIVISENLNPLISADFTLANSMTGRFEIKSSRILTLNFSDYTMVENDQTSITVGGGYKMKGFKTPIKIFGFKLDLKNEMNFTCDFSWTDNFIVNHKLGQNLHIPTQGATKWTISPKVDYMVNQNLNISFFLTHTNTQPRISTNFPMTQTNFGLRLKFNIAQQ